MKNKEQKVRLAVVGIGKMGLLHACILSALPNVMLEAVCDKSFLLRKVFEKALPHIRFVDDLRELGGFGLDAVYVTTPIPSHFALAKIVYSEGIASNLFVEKTLASNFVQARELCEYATAKGGVNMVGYMKRFSVTFNKAKELLDETILGDLSSFEAYAYSSDFVSASGHSSASGARGGVLSDLGSHVIDLALWFFGDLRVESAKSKSLTSMGSEDFVEFAVGSVGDSLEGNFKVSWCMKDYRMPEFGLVVRGNKGKLTVNDDEVVHETADGKLKKWYRHDLGDNVDFLLGDPEYCREDQRFVDSVLHKRKSEPSFASASKVDELIEKVRGRSETR